MRQIETIWRNNDNDVNRVLTQGISFSQYDKYRMESSIFQSCDQSEHRSHQQQIMEQEGKVKLIDWVEFDIREHASGYMRRPCKGHGDGLL